MLQVWRLMTLTALMPQSYGRSTMGSANNRLLKTFNLNQIANLKMETP